MKKAISKRVKITGKGKMLYRKAGHNHFNAKASRKLQRRQKQMAGFSNVIKKKVKGLLQN